MTTAVEIRVHYIGSLKHKLGCDHDHLVLQPTVCVRDVLEELVERHGAELRDWFYNQYGWLDPRCMVFIDGEDSRELGGLDASLDGVAEIEMAIALPMAGG
ncbi:MAG: MoaD/ThiS family protein [Acidimicrobiia bacterium]